MTLYTALVDGVRTDVMTGARVPSAAQSAGSSCWKWSIRKSRNIRIFVGSCLQLW